QPDMEIEDYYAEVGLATLPRDRWGALGLVDDYPEGSVWTTPIRLPERGCALSLNADGVDSMSVEVANEDFALMPDYSGELSGKVSGPDGLNCPVSWSSRSLADLAGRTVRFRVTIQRNNDPRLYALYLTAGTNVATDIKLPR
ncbi:MAG: hypothetical protein KC964_12460, partial [Candidatus Omnitrophica bacterium]|nr:hypothetical protein [Candidatus Omnitrophota bacterium]